MKKLISIILTLSLVLSLCATAFADTTVNIDSDSERNYAGYKLLDLTTNLKCKDTVHTHTEDCYDYVYAVNSKYRGILQKEVCTNADTSFWGTITPPTNSSDVTDAQIIEYFNAQLPDTSDTYGTLREVADRIYPEVQKLDADKTVTGTKSFELGKGYWLIADVTNLTGHEANSLVMINTVGDETVTLKLKTDIPTLEKKVKDTNDSNAADETNNKWQDSADYDFGDTVPFKLTATLPSNIDKYSSYQLVFHDKMSAGLTLNTNNEDNPPAITVYKYANATAASADTVEGRTDVTGYFTTTTTALEDDCTFEVSCNNILAIEGVTKDTVFVVEYNATLNTSANIGATGNPNEAYLKFSNNPYGEGTGKTVEDKVVVFTYKLTVNKTDGAGKALKGAGFTLSKKNSAGNYVVIGNELKGDDMTTFEWTGLDDGEYKLEETTVPAGYNKMADKEFTISASHSEEADNPVLTSLTGGDLVTGEFNTTCNIVTSIVNQVGTVLPETGAKGTMMLLMGGGLLVILAGVFMVTRKKMSIYED